MWDGCVRYVWCMSLCMCIFDVCIYVFISRKQIHGNLLTFKAQQKEDPISFPKYKAKETAKPLKISALSLQGATQAY